MLLQPDQLKALLTKQGLIRDDEFEKVKAFAQSNSLSIEEALIERNIIPDETLGLIVANYLKIPFVALSKISIGEDIFHIVPEKLARRQKLIAFERNAQGIKIAIANPYNTELLQMLAKKTSVRILPHLATERDIANAYRVYRRDLQKSFDTLIKEELESQAGTEDGDDAPIAKIVDLMISYASQDKASDIHIEPDEKSSNVRFRIDGILHDVLALSKETHERIITRIKVMSRLRTDEHLAPQDGKIRIKTDSDNLDIRVSILPLAEGEKVVMRLLSSHMGKLSLSDLGMSERDLKKVERAYSKSFGMILSTGPTGSGKTSSIYAILRVLNTREKNITTIEDPVEYRIRGINQIQVNTKSNLTFASGLRSILRQDPNIVFVGEIRDGETAGIAVNAALTGHLVLSTLHTNDSATAIPRLADMKVEPFLVASTVNVVIAQRLVRRICDNCRISFVTTEAELLKHLPQEVLAKHYVFAGEKKELRIYRGQGCKLCHFTGYVGRVGIFEILEISSSIRTLITGKNDSDVIFKKAVEEGMTTMLDDGLQKVAKGQTTIEEVLRVTKVESA